MISKLIVQHFCSDSFSSSTTEQLLEKVHTTKSVFEKVRIKNELDSRVLERLMELGCQEIHKHAYDLWQQKRNRPLHLRDHV